VEVRPMAEYLNSNGYHVYAPLLPGHGTSPKDLNNKTWKDWVSAIKTIYMDIKDKYKYIFIAGESMGGVLSCYIAADYPDIRGIVLYAPAIKVKNLGFSRFIRYIRKFMPKNSNNKKNRKQLFPWQGYNVHPTSAAFQMYRLQKATLRKLSSIKQPSIIFHGKLDQTISSESSLLVFNKIDSIKKEYVFLENSPHTIILDHEFNFVAKKTLDFFRYNEK
jgi:carboxylesterase